LESDVPGRIITLQRQARELGRLRTGYSEPTGGRRNKPVRSETWIVTSPAERYIETAAAVWGRQVEKWQPQGNGAAQYRVVTDAVVIDAILPSGDPLTQAYEMWSAGGCQRRCDGERDWIDDAACQCRAEFGDEFWETAPKPELVCKPTTRLNVVLPQIGDVGVFRMETHSFYAANEIAATIDLIRSATHGETTVPIRLRIEQRTRVAQGKTKHYPVVAVELQDGFARQMYAALESATHAALPAGGREQLAIGASPAEVETEPAPELASNEGEAPAARAKLTSTQVLTMAKLCRNVEQLQDLWRSAKADGVLKPEVKAELERRANALKASTPAPAEPATDELESEAELAIELDGKIVDDDTAALWSQCIAAAGNAGMTRTSEVTSALWRSQGVSVERASSAQLRTFLAELQAGGVQ
jgi:Recombination directionality factor-like